MTHSTQWILLSYNAFTFLQLRVSPVASLSSLHYFSDCRPISTRFYLWGKIPATQCPPPCRCPRCPCSCSTAALKVTNCNSRNVKWLLQIFLTETCFRLQPLLPLPTWGLQLVWSHTSVHHDARHSPNPLLGQPAPMLLRWSYPEELHILEGNYLRNILSSFYSGEVSETMRFHKIIYFPPCKTSHKLIIFISLLNQARSSMHQEKLCSTEGHQEPPDFRRVRAPDYSTVLHSAANLARNW